ncbi:MAG: transposase [Microcoleus sp. SIO2G3]|nr:transposase [Microcoleus sp. SIO2G3]
MSTKPRRQFNPEQKAEAVRIVTQSGKPISQIAKEMGLTESALRNWVKQADINQTADPNGALTTQERQELAQLRREVKRLQMERDFLKKVSAFFAAETSPMN